MAEQSLALPHSQIHGIAPSQVLGQDRTVPERGRQTKIARRLAQIPLQATPVFAIQCARSTATLPFAQGVKPTVFKALYPALHRLERQKLIAAEWKTSENNQRVRVYRLSAAGKKKLASERSRWAQISQAIAGILGPAGEESEA